MKKVLTEKPFTSHDLTDEEKKSFFLMYEIVEYGPIYSVSEYSDILVVRGMNGSYIRFDQRSPALYAMTGRFTPSDEMRLNNSMKALADFIKTAPFRD